jgi:AcrR family transcriptional regulator
MAATATRPRRTQKERSETTTGELLAAARELFARDGYAATSLDAIAAAANVTKGALYHHFDGKRDVFRAVYEVEQRRLTEIESAAYWRKRDPWEAFYAGCRAFLEASIDPGVQRITLLDAPGALGWETMREIESDAFAMTVDGLRRAMDAGCIPKRPTEPLAHLVFGAVCEAAMAIARAENQKAALRSLSAELRRLLDALARA